MKFGELCRLEAEVRYVYGDKLVEIFSCVKRKYLVGCEL